MRLAVLTLITSLAVAALPAANAAPTVSRAPTSVAVVPVAGGCGPGFYRGRWGECLPYYGPRRAYGWGHYRHPRWYHHRHWRRYR